MKKRKKSKLIKCFTFFFIFFLVKNFTSNVYANNLLPNVSISVGENAGTSSTVQLIVLFSLITIAPFLLVMLTSFTRIIISLHFLRNALGTQQMPPNQILIGIAIFLTIFVMSSTFTEINNKALTPYSEGKLNERQLIEEGMKPIRVFMLKQVKNKDLELFTSLSGKTFESPEQLPDHILIPSFILSEITKGFIIGFLIYIPFIVIDMVVSSVLMAMGMMMLPPALISAPFKIILFILIDGWSLIIGSILKTFG